MNPLRYLLCKLFHRNWRYGAIREWHSSVWHECGTCSRVWATGRRRRR